MATEIDPQWTERMVPDGRAHDIVAYGSKYSDRLQAFDGMAVDDTASLLDQINAMREPLHQQLRELPSTPLVRWYLPAIQQIVCKVAGPPPVPDHRIAISEDVMGLPAYKEAVSRDMAPETPLTGYQPLLGFSHIERQFTERGDATHDFDILASAVARTAMAGPLDIYLRKDAPPQYLYGSLWTSERGVYGEVLHGAAVAKVAALVRQELRINGHADEAPTPMLRPYYHEQYAAPESMLAVGIDLINGAAGFKPQQAGMFEPLWEFARSGRDESARQEMAQIIGRASAGAIRLEQLEAVRRGPALPIGLLHRIEEACGVDVSLRPSAAFA